MNFDDLEKHPSSMAKSAVEFLRQARVSAKTRAVYEDVLTLFIIYLTSSSDELEETPDGEYLLKDGWETYWGHAFESFVDFWLPRHVLTYETLQAKAPGILRKWVKWSFEKGYLGEERYLDFLEAVPVSKSREAKRLQKASDLLYELHTPDPSAWLTRGAEKLLPIQRLGKPEDVREGYMMVVRLEGEGGYVKDEDGKEIGPVLFGKALVETLRVGDVVNVAIGRLGQCWQVLESGNVYPESQWMGL